MSGEYVAGWKFGKEWLDRLDIDEKAVHRITLTADANSVVQLIIEMYAVDDQLKETDELVRKYELHEVDA